MEDENYPIYDLNFTVCAKISFTKTKSREIFIFSIEKNRRFSCIEIFILQGVMMRWVNASFLFFFFLIQNLLKRSIGKYLAGYFRVSIEGGCACTVSGAWSPYKSTEVFSIDPVHLAGHFNPRARTINGESLFSLTRRFVRHPGILGLEASDGFKTTRFETWRNKCQRRFERWV